MRVSDAYEPDASMANSRAIQPSGAVAVPAQGQRKSGELPIGSVDAEKVRAQIRIWQERVLDLTKSNPLIGLNRSRVAKLQVKTPKPIEVFTRLVLDESAIRLPLVRKQRSSRPEALLEAPEDQLTVESGDVEFDAAPIDLMRRLRRIYDNARTTLEERGITTLYLTFGALRWRDDLFGDSVSPLWMVPCEITSKGPDAPLRLSKADEEMQINPALEYCLRERHKVKLPTLPEEPDAKSLPVFLKRVQEAVREQKWEVVDELWFSTFTFESLVIYQDLKEMAEAATSNPIVASLARAVAPAGASEALPENLDSLPCPDAVPIPVLPTDSSQLEALTYAAGGRHVVVHGPPGTGKSQTIANLIANALTRNRKVLFVSAKMAALNVVYDRLKEMGLERFCLEAHSTKAGKAKVIDELRRTLESEPTHAGASLAEELDNLLRVRRELNAYVQELHAPLGALKLTPYMAIGRLARNQAPEVPGPLPWADPLAVTSSELNTCLDLLDELGAAADLFDGRGQHPWRGFKSTEFGIREQEDTERALRLVSTAGTEILDALNVLSGLIPPPAQLSLEELARFEEGLDALAMVEKLPEQWWQQSATDLSCQADLFETAKANARESENKSSELKKSIDEPIGSVIELLAPIEGEFRTWYSRLRPDYWRWRSTVKCALKADAKKDLASFRSYYRLAMRLREIERWFDVQGNKLGSNVSTATEYHKRAVEFRAAAFLQEARSATDRSLAEATAQLTPTMRASAGALVSRLPVRNAALKDAIAGLEKGWPDGFADGVSVTRAPLSVAVTRTQEVLDGFKRAREWVLLQQIIGRCDSHGLTPFIASLGQHSAKLVRQAFERRFYALWTSAAVQKNPDLQDFSGTRRHDLIEKFCLIDSRVRRLAVSKAQSVACQASDRVKAAQDNVGTASEVGILRYELQKKKRIRPLRKLFSEIPHVLQALKPCLLMSPISVSTYLKPGTVFFDLVVFDEASQLPTAEAVPSILRSKQVTVAGDSNQLPPTSFFEASLMTEDDDSDEAQIGQRPLESLLDDCVAIIPVFQESYLRWHYRSRDERLIKFSNHYFYENRLTTFPASVSDAPGQGVRHVYVTDGVWDRGRSRTNRKEARVVAKLALEHCERHPDRSLGIVAMNTSQREAIEDAISEELQARPDLCPLFDATRHERFFVKSLENVQGDERDTMIISIGYGKDPNGALTYNFGPINVDGGWRRLNVLVTRAKWECVLVTSLRSADLSGINPGNRGAVALRNFMEFAERNAGLPSDPIAVISGETNDFEDAVRAAIVERGYTVDQQVGASRYRIDLGIRDKRDPSRYLLGVECDGATYHSSRTARDRDLLRQEVLRKMGWRLHRVWSTEWFHDREKAIVALLKSIEQAEAAPATFPVYAPPPPDTPDPSNTSEPPSTPAKTESTPPRRYGAGIPYRSYCPASRRSREYLLDKRYLAVLASTVGEIVRVEGPIQADLILERAKEVHGVERAGSNVQANVKSAIQRAVKSQAIQHASERSFLRAVGSELKTFRVPGDGFKRPIELIAPEEIELAVLYLVEDQFGMLRDQVPQAVARLFGIDRLRADSAERISDVVDALERRGVLRSSGPQVFLA